MKYEFTIEEKEDYRGRLEFAVYRWSIYPPSSVLAGQNCKQYMASYNTIAQAFAEFPLATFGYRDACNYYNHLPGEDDPVPGGMYPDDI